MVIEMQKFVSVEAYESLMLQPEYAGRSFELIEGVVAEMPGPNGEHSEIEMLFSFRIASHVYENGLGRMSVGDGGFVLERNPHGKDTVRGLDIAYISFDKSPEPLPRSSIPFAPDLAVEVVSPSNLAWDINLKVTQLLNAGTRVIWIVYPETRQVEAHTEDGPMTYHENDTLSGGDVLPGFEIRVADIFPS